MRFRDLQSSLMALKRFITNMFLIAIVSIGGLFFLMGSGIAKGASYKYPKSIQGDPFSTSSDKYTISPFYLDEDGVLYYDYGGNYEKLGKYSNPTFVADYANALFSDYLDGSEKCRSLFLTQVDSLIKRSRIDDNEYAYWTYPFTIPNFKCPVGWYSAMTSGRVLGLLARAHYLTGDDSYLEFAKKVLNKMSLPLEQGGMTTYVENGAWLEEDAYPGADSFKVLNGHIFGLAGLYDYAIYTNDKNALNLSKKCFKAVEKSIDEYDSGFLSYYCAYMPVKIKSFANLHGYNETHIMQLLWLYDVTKESIFLHKAMRFMLYENFMPEIIASSTVDEKSHGADKMHFSFGNDYWSSSVFPVELDVDCKKEISVSSIILCGNAPINAVKDASIKVSEDGIDWKEVTGDIKYDGQYYTIVLDKEICFRYCKVIIKECEGKVVALNGIGFVQNEQSLSPVFFSEQMFRRKGAPNYNRDMKLLFDNNKATSISIPRGFQGELIVPCNGNMVSIYANCSNNNDIRSSLVCYESDDLKSWSEIDFYMLGAINICSELRFIKVELNCLSDMSIFEIEYRNKKD